MRPPLIWYPLYDRVTGLPSTPRHDINLSATNDGFSIKDLSKYRNSGIVLRDLFGVYYPEDSHAVIGTNDSKSIVRSILDPHQSYFDHALTLLTQCSRLFPYVYAYVGCPKLNASFEEAYALHKTLLSCCGVILDAGGWLLFRQDLGPTLGLICALPNLQLEGSCSTSTRKHWLSDLDVPVGLRHSDTTIIIEGSDPADKLARGTKYLKTGLDLAIDASNIPLSNWEVMCNTEKETDQ